MADYFPELVNRPGNLMFMRDGSVWANYLLRGVNCSPYREESITACQETNELLFSQLSRLRATDFLLLGLKTQTPPNVIMDRCAHGVPDFNSGRYDQLLKDFNALYLRIMSGEYREYQRMYWLSIQFPVGMSGIDKLLSKVALVDPHHSVDANMLAELEQQYFAAIPAQFTPTRTSPDHVRWVFDRARQRGITAPFLPDSDAVRVAVDGPHSFAEISIDTRSDIDSLYEHFVTRVTADNPAVLSRAKRRRLLNMLRHTFTTVRSARAVTIRNVETRTPEFPDGYTSYQTLLGIARYPSIDSYGINRFTYLVDQQIGVDADFAIRFDFDQTAASKHGMREVMLGINSEDRANSRDELDLDDYDDRRSELRDWRSAVKSEAAPIGMRAATMFCFAHQNKPHLDRCVDAIYQHFVNHDFTPMLPVCGQMDLWQQMMPGAVSSPTVEDLKQETTVRLFSGFMPVRRTEAGDSVGVPIAINKENELGQIVRFDLLGATDKGNASVGVTGAPGKGKSNFMKLMLAYMIDLNRYVHVIDQSPHGEYEVFSSTLTKPEVIDVFAPGKSLDVLKCFPPKDAARVFMDLWLPLMLLQHDSDEANLLSILLAPDFRKSARINSTRDLMQHLTTVPDEAARVLKRKLSFWSRQEYTRAFIDPEDVNYPPFDPDAHCVIYRTHRLKAWRPGEIPFEKAEPSQQFATMAYTAIAAYTEHRFSRIKGPCAFFGDEMHFLEGSPVLQRLIEDPNATGRKEGNFVVVAAQLAHALSGKHYALIKKKLLLGQETRDNASAALKYGDLPQTQRLITRILEASPADPDRNNMPRVGREGEGWFNDGNGNIIFVQTLAQLRDDRRRMADTTSSKMIRAEELDISANGHKQSTVALSDGI